MRITGHRGAKNEWPENTLLGMQKAIDCGVDSIEIDVHLTKDNQLVVIHDATIDRTTNGTGPVSDYTYNQLLKYDAGKGEKIPTLIDVLKLAEKENIHVFIESKLPQIAPHICKTIKSLNAYSYSTVICFYHPLLQHIKKIDPKINVGSLVFCNPLDPASLLKPSNSYLLAIAIELVDSDVVKNCHKAGAKIAVWNANTVEEFQRMKALGVDFIMTDVPSLIMPLVDNYTKN